LWFHSGDPYYGNTDTAKTVFWFGIVPFTLLITIGGGAILGLVIGVIKDKINKTGE